MNELTTQAKQLPDTLEDLTRFVLVGREKLNAVRAEIRAIERVQLAAEVHEQKLQEAQEIAEAVLDAETKLGELTSKLEKSVGGRPSKTNPTDGESFQTKAEQLKELGITHAERFEQLASHPDIVEKAKEDARAEGRIVTRSDVLMRIAPPKTRNQSMKDFKKQAREEHKEFKEAPKNVIDIADIKRDKENLEVIALDIETVIRKAFAAVGAIGFLKAEELKIMLDNLTLLAIRDMRQSVQYNIRILEHLAKTLEERRTK